LRDFNKRRGECVGPAADARAKIVSSVFARAADRHLYDHGGKWRQDEHKHPADNAETAVAIAASEEHAELRKHRNGASNGSSMSQDLTCACTNQLSCLLRDDSDCR
jgi:hypothetical protein